MAKFDDLTPERQAALIEQAAQFCHEMSCRYNESIGEPLPSWSALKTHQRREPASGVRFYIDTPNASANNSHDAWRAGLEAEGWTQGAAKSRSAKIHPGLIAFDQLPEIQRIKSHLFRSAALAFIDQRLGLIR